MLVCLRSAKSNQPSEAENWGGGREEGGCVFSKITDCLRTLEFLALRIIVMTESWFFLPQAACLSHLKGFILHRDLDLPKCQEKGEKEKVGSPSTEA